MFTSAHLVTQQDNLIDKTSYILVVKSGHKQNVGGPSVFSASEEGWKLRTGFE